MLVEPIRVLLIEDNPGDALLVREALDESDPRRFELAHADRLASGLAAIESGGIDVVLLDLSLPDRSGLDSFRAVRGAAPRLPIVVLSGLDDEELAVSAVSEGAQDYLVKGKAGPDLLARSIRYALQRKRAEDELARRNALLAEMASTDELTGLANRSMLHQRLQQCVGSAPADGMFALLLLDLDRFKEINDTLGHHHGDEVLKRLKPRLMAAVRDTDLVARLGGDEFAIVLDGTGEEGALMVADRIRAELRRPIVVEGKELDVGVSIGIALYPDHGDVGTTLMKRADIAMYAAKRSRAGRLVYVAGQGDSSPHRLTVASDLRRGIEEGQLRLQYQPKIDLASGEVVGAEALVRWQHPREGLIPPRDFIPLAEHTGLIRPLGLWTLGAALRQCRDWDRAGLDLGVAVNLAPESLQDERMAGEIFRLLGEAEVPPHRLTVEVTETAMMADPAGARATLVRLHAQGVGISIDDFGTGYSSLAYLKELPVDEVKVDRSFVRDMLTDSRDACIVRSVIDLGHNLGLRVVAEGVEDRAAVARLMAWGCDLAQGYSFSRPLSAEDLAGWLASRAEEVKAWSGTGRREKRPGRRHRRRATRRITPGSVRLQHMSPV